MTSSGLDVLSSLTQSLGHANPVFAHLWSDILELAKFANWPVGLSLASRHLISHQPTTTQISDNAPLYSAVSLLNDLITDRLSLRDRNPRNPEHWLVLGHFFLLRNDFPNAYASYSNASRLKAEPARTYFAYGFGITMQHFHRHLDACECFSTALESLPPSPVRSDALLRLALCYRALDRIHESVSTFEGLTDFPPAGLCPEDVYLQIAFTQQLAGQRQAAEAVYAELYARHPTNRVLVRQYCWFLWLHSDQIQLANSIIQNFGEPDPVLQFAAAMIAQRQGNVGAAADLFRVCEAHWNDVPYYWFQMGLMYLRNRQMQEARVAFQRVLFLMAEIEDAWLYLGMMAEMEGNAEEARQFYQSGWVKCQSSELRRRERARVRTEIPGIVEGGLVKWFSQEAEQVAERWLGDILLMPDTEFEIGQESWKTLEPLGVVHRSAF